MEDVIEEVPDLSAMQRLKQSYMDLQKSVKHTLSCAKLLLKEGTEKLKATRNKVLEKLSLCKEKFNSEKIKYVLGNSLLALIAIGALLNPNVEEKFEIDYSSSFQPNIIEVQQVKGSEYGLEIIDNFSDLEYVSDTLVKSKKKYISNKKESEENKIDSPLYREEGEPLKNGIVEINNEEYYIFKCDNTEWIISKTKMDEMHEKDLEKLKQEKEKKEKENPSKIVK